MATAKLNVSVGRPGVRANAAVRPGVPARPDRWLAKATKSSNKVLSKVSKVSLPVAKLVPGIGVSAAAIQTASQIGGQAIASNKVLTAAARILPKTDIQGFQAGVALMNAPNLTPAVLMKARGVLKPEERRGFDAAVAIQAGMATSKPSQALTDAQKAGFYMTTGLQGATKEMQVAILKEVTKDPAAKQGAIAAAKEIKSKGFFQRVREFLFGEPLQPTSAAAKPQAPVAARKSPKPRAA